MNHAEFTLESVSLRYNTLCRVDEQIKKRILQVEGVSGLFSVEVTDAVHEVAARSLYTGHECQECKRRFIQFIMDNEDALSLLISCEHILFNLETKNFEIYRRVDASLATQKVFKAPKPYLGPFDKLIEVQQRQYGISSAISEKPILATWHLADCIAFFGFETATRRGFLFHFDQSAKPQAEMRRLSSQFSGSEVQYRFLGGSDDKAARIFRIKAYIPENFKERTFPERELLSLDAIKNDSFWSRSVRLSRSVVFDLRKEDPLAEIEGYEPLINPSSSYHARSHTQEEADQFCSGQSFLMKPAM